MRRTPAQMTTFRTTIAKLYNEGYTDAAIARLLGCHYTQARNEVHKLQARENAALEQFIGF